MELSDPIQKLTKADTDCHCYKVKLWPAYRTISGNEFHNTSCYMTMSGRLSLSHDE